MKFSLRIHRDWKGSLGNTDGLRGRKLEELITFQSSKTHKHMPKVKLFPPQILAAIAEDANRLISCILPSADSDAA